MSDTLFWQLVGALLALLGPSRNGESCTGQGGGAWSVRLPSGRSQPRRVSKGRSTRPRPMARLGRGEWHMLSHGETLMSTVLVAYATKHGPAREVAEAIATMIGGQAVNVDFRPLGPSGSRSSVATWSCWERRSIPDDGTVTRIDSSSGTAKICCVFLSPCLGWDHATGPRSPGGVRVPS
jgi:hypothetical protein